MRTLRPLALVATLVAGLGAGLWLTPTLSSQTTLASTTFASAVTAGTLTVSVASATGIDVGDYLVSGAETMRVTATSGTTITVIRGWESRAQAHQSGALVYVGAPSVFYGATPPSGACTATAEANLPHVAIPGGRVFDCRAGRWVEKTLQDDIIAGSPTVEGRLFVRESFDQGFIVAENDATGLLIKSVTDTDDNVVMGSPLGLISYREEQTKTASSWLVADGVLDIKGDNTTTAEGVEIVFGGDGANTTEGVIVAGSQGACISASITITDVSGAGHLVLGFRQNETWTDAAAYDGYTRWNVIGQTATSGAITSKQEVASSTTTDTPGVTWADGETRQLKVCISPTGVPTAFYTANNSAAYIPVTMTNSGVTQTAGHQFYPFLSFLISGTDGPDPLVNWVQLEHVR